jgi:ABC-type multidrug transport system fused ATPase/permease subunit
MLGPALPNTQVFNCDSATKFLAQIQTALDCLSDTEEHNHFQYPGLNQQQLTEWLQNSSLHQTINNFASLIKLLENPTNISPAKQQEAFKAFAEITNYQQVNANTITDNIADAQQKILDLNSFYIFMSLGIVLILVVWIITIFGAISWETALFLTVFIFLFLYLFSIAYRKQGQNIINNERTELNNLTAVSQQNFEQNITHWIRGLYAAAVIANNNEE